ncbi:hypothetical protein JCM14469_22430 [Desulfatiferula olefinivorans]
MNPVRLPETGMPSADDRRFSDPESVGRNGDMFRYFKALQE